MLLCNSYDGFKGNDPFLILLKLRGILCYFDDLFVGNVILMRFQCGQCAVQRIESEHAHFIVPYQIIQWLLQLGRPYILDESPI